MYLQFARVAKLQILQVYFDVWRASVSTSPGLPYFCIIQHSKCYQKLTRNILYISAIRNALELAPRLGLARGACRSKQADRPHQPISVLQAAALPI